MKRAVKVYHGFGHKHDIVLFGHVFRKLPRFNPAHSRNPFANMLRLLRLFFVKPIPAAPVSSKWNEQLVTAKTEYDGFFRLEWQSEEETAAGWYDVAVATDANGLEVKGNGKIFIPHITQYAFISDIDDTVLISHSATKWKRMKELLGQGGELRDVFVDVSKHYELLSKAFTTADARNPFFYVSSSEWNLYDYLVDIFRRHQMPEGAFILNQVKRWYEFFKTGKTKHEGKLLRILRLFEVFPNQRFVLLGDNSQQDPAIYAKLTEKYGHRIHAVYIRNIVKSHQQRADISLQEIASRNIHVCQFTNSEEAIAHSRSIGLIE